MRCRTQRSREPRKVTYISQPSGTAWRTPRLQSARGIRRGEAMSTAGKRGGRQQGRRGSSGRREARRGQGTAFPRQQPDGCDHGEGPARLGVQLEGPAPQRALEVMLDSVPTSEADGQPRGHRLVSTVIQNQGWWWGRGRLPLQCQVTSPRQFSGLKPSDERRCWLLRRTVPQHHSKCAW